jgi:plastocyanin
MRLTHAVGVVLSGIIALVLPATAFAVPGAPQTFVIGVDHVDPANKRPDLHRLFEYTDFFSRQVRIHQGDTVDFRYAPGSFHIVGLAKSEKVARAVYPFAFADVDGGMDTAIGTGLPKVVLGPSNYSITGGSTHGGGTIGTDPGNPVCGVAGLPSPCTFSGGDDIEVVGPTAGYGPTEPAQVDQLVNVTAAPGEYAFFCFLHPGMRGTLNVVGRGAPTSTQKDIDARGLAQFQQDREQALQVERRLDRLDVRGEQPGERTFVVRVGATAADNHVAIDEMLPNRKLDLQGGDRVRFLWPDPHNIHSVAFPANSLSLPDVYGWDCGSSFSNSRTGPPPVCLEPGDTQPESIADPGTSPPGTSLTSPTAIVDSGLLFGTGYGVKPSTQRWSIRTDAATAGTYLFQCTLHDAMQGQLNVNSDSADERHQQATPSATLVRRPGWRAPL